MKNKILVIIGFLVVIGWAYFTSQSGPFDPSLYTGVAIATVFLVLAAIVAFSHKGPAGPRMPRMNRNQVSVDRANLKALRDVQDTSLRNAINRRK